MEFYEFESRLERPVKVKIPDFQTGERLNHIVFADQFNTSTIDRLGRTANRIRLLAKSKEGYRFLSDLLRHKRAMLYFTQPSTRTFLSFMAACQILGLSCTEVRDPATSSETKGESPYDSMRMFSSYFDGVIVRKMIEKGDTVQPGQPLLEFADLTYLQVEVAVPVRLMGGLKKGQLVPVKLDVGDVRVEARVAQIFPSADELRHTVTVKFDLPVNVPGGPGMYAEVTVPDPSMQASAVPVIPASAVLWRGSLPAVYVAGDGNSTELRLVRLGDYLGNNQVAVLSGLQIGERIHAVPPSEPRAGWSHAAE